MKSRSTDMNTYAVLLRGINVGGRNKVPMAQLKDMLQQLGYTNVTTYIASGNVVLRSHHEPEYQNMTMRNWNTTTRLLELVEAAAV